MDDLFFTQFNNPFANLSPEDRDKIGTEITETAEKNFNESLEKLIEKIDSINPLYLLSTLSIYELSGGISETGEKIKYSDSRFYQPHLELCQALALRSNFAEDKLVQSKEIREIRDLLIFVTDNFNLKRFKQVIDVNSPEKLEILKIQEWLRLYTSKVRNWGYYHRVVCMAKRLYSDLDPFFKEYVGLEATLIIEIFENLVTYFEDVLKERIDNLRNVFKAKTIEEKITKYCQSINQSESIEEMITFIEENKMNLQDIDKMIIAYSDVLIPKEFLFIVEDLAICMDIESIIIDSVLSKLSYQFGDLKNHKIEYFFLNNPVWKKPLIKLDKGIYFCTVPQLFFSFVFPTLNSLLPPQILKDKVQDKHRANFLENEVKRLFTEAFPQGIFEQNFKWKDSNIEYETDFLIQIDSYLFIVEAKSGSVSDASQRGALDSAKDDIEELLIKPAIQSKRFADKIIDLKEKQIFPDVFQSLNFDLNKIQKIVRLSVTLEEFATIQTRLSDLKETNWYQDFDSTLTITLADLEIIFDVLTTISQKIHYLTKRIELEKNIQYLANELDLLGFYLETGFNISHEEFKQKELIFSEMSEKLDQYYEALDQEITTQKPHLKLTKWWQDILSQIEEKCIYRWLEVAMMMLNISFEYQEQLEKEFKTMRINVKNNWQPEKDIDNQIILPLPEQKESIALFAFKESQWDKREQLLTEIAKYSFSEFNTNRCLVIAVNVDDENGYPYNLLFLGESDIPKKEQWLWKNKQALNSVLKGIEEAKQRQGKSLGDFSQYADLEIED